MAIPETDSHFAILLEQARAMRDTLRERQQFCEDLGRIPEETHQSFLRGGFYRAVQPHVFGGHEFTLREFVQLVAEIARGCIDTGWVFALIASEPAAFLRLFPEKAQREAYQPDGDGRTAIVLAPGGSAVKTEDGYRVQGVWDYCSGCDIATHLLGSVLLRDSPSKPPTGMGMALLDRDHFTIIDNWNMVGMQGTGSRRVVAEDHVIESHRVLPLDGDLWDAGDSPYPNPLYRGTPLAASGFGSYAVAVGGARGALDLYGDLLQKKKWITPPFPFRSEMPEIQQSYGTAQALVDTAEAALLTLSDQQTELNRSGAKAEAARRIHRAGLQCLELSWQAVELMFRTGGSSAATKTASLGRYFRGLAVIRTHVGMQADHVSINVARLKFGLPPLSPL